MKTIKVTEEHIKHGCKAQAHGCPIALAIKDSDSTINCVGVWPLDKIIYVYHEHRDTSIRYKFTPEIAAFVKAFDYTVDEAKPFEFDLDSLEKVE